MNASIKWKKIPTREIKVVDRILNNGRVILLQKQSDEEWTRKAVETLIEYYNRNS